MRKLLTVLAVCTVCAVASGCGSSNETSSGSVTTTGETAAATEVTTATTAAATTAVVTTEVTTECQHVWKDATCTSPKKCGKCGKTEGRELGHDWDEGSCTTPKKCKRCGSTMGTALGHDYQNGICSRCGQADPDHLFISNVTTVQQLEDYLNQTYTKIDTPFGEIKDIAFHIESLRTESEKRIFPYDFYIQVAFNPIIANPKIEIENSSIKGQVFLPWDLDCIGVTAEQKSAMAEAMKSFQISVANDAMTAFPAKKIVGGFYSFSSSGWWHTGSGTNPNDWHYSDADTDRYFTWCNYYSKLGAIAGSYDESYITGFNWSPSFDDKWYGYNA